MDLSWDIVVWANENTIDYIPSSWANAEKTEYKYPNKTQSSFKVKKMIGLCASLDDDFDWLEATCKVEAVKDLELAKELCDRGQFTSNLEVTDPEEHGDPRRSKKRKIKKNRNFLSSSSDSDDNQKVKNRKQTSARASVGFVRDNFETPPQHETIRNLGKTVTARRLELHDSGSHNIGASTSGLLSTSSRHYAEVQSPKTQSAASSNELLLKELFEIKLGVKENKKLLQGIFEKLGRDNLTLNNIEETQKLPCESEEEIMLLENEIRTIIGKFKDLISSLYLVGGSTPHKTVYLIMNKVFGRQLALKYSGQGKKKKNSFCDLKLYEAVKAATRKRHPQVSEEEIKKSVGLFLSTAKARLPRTSLNDKENVQHENNNDEARDQDGLDDIF